jgi:hypothetical protein
MRKVGQRLSRKSDNNSWPLITAFRIPASFHNMRQFNSMRVKQIITCKHDTVAAFTKQLSVFIISSAIEQIRVICHSELLHEPSGTQPNDETVGSD